MNIFQRLKVNSILKKSPSTIALNYNSYPDFIKNDFRIVDKVLDRVEINVETLAKYLETNPYSINDIVIGITISESNFITLLEKKKSLIEKIKDKNMLHFLIFNLNIDVNKEQFQIMFLEDKIKLINKNVEYYYYDEKENEKLIDQLLPEVLIQLYNKGNISIEKLPDNLKVKLAIENAGLFLSLSPNLQLQVLNENSFMLKHCANVRLVERYLDFALKREQLNESEVANLLSLCDRGFKIFNPEVLAMKFKNHQQLLSKILSNENNFTFEDWSLNNNSLKTTIGKADIIEFFNNDILANNDENELMNYLDNPSPKKLETLLAKTYGDHVHSIFLKRPNICIQIIDSAQLFDKKIYDNLGIEFINQVLNYSIQDLNYFIPIILSGDRLMNNYVLMYNYIKSQLGENIDILNLSIKKTISLCSILKEHDFNAIIKDDVLGLSIKDYLFSNCIIYFKNIDEFNSYFENKNKLVDNQNNNKDQLRVLFGIDNAELDMILAFIFKDIDKNGELDQLDREIIQYVYMLNNQQKFNYNELIDYIKRNPQQFNSLRIKTLCNKIKKLYINDFESQITNDERVESEELEKEFIDDIKIVNFKGNDFSFLISGVRGNAQSKKFNGNQQFSAQELVNKWMTMENGVSTISTSMLSEANIYSEGGNVYNTFFGFNSFDDGQILTFASYDAGAYHQPRKVVQHEGMFLQTTYKQNISTLSKKSVRDNLSEARGQPNETTIRRYDNKGNRVLPDFILVYADRPEQLKDAIEIVKEFKKIGHNISIYRIYPEYYKNRTYTPDVRVKDYPVYFDPEIARMYSYKDKNINTL